MKMKNNKINTLFIALLGLFMLLGADMAFGQKKLLRRRVINPGIVVKSVNVEQDKDLVNTEMVFEINGVEVGKRDQIRLMPILRSGDDELLMPPVAITGSIRRRLIKRQEVLTRELDSVYISLRPRGKNPVTAKVNYKISTPVEGWMQNSHLTLYHESCFCPGEYILVSEDILLNGIQMAKRPEMATEFNPHIHFIVPEREAIKLRSESGSANIVYKAGRSDINMSLGNNILELEKVRKSIEYVRSESTVTISSLEVNSYASPEGKWQSNQRLSEARAASLSVWISRNANLQGGINIQSRGMGEDWTSLEEYIKNDPTINPSDAANVIALIGSVSNPDTREARIRSYKPSVYSYILNNLYPLLRRSEYKIEFTVPEFTLEKSKEVFQTRPDLLSLAEFYAIAGEYKQGSGEFIKVFQTASKMFPDDKIASLNAAAAQLSVGNLKVAEEELLKHESDPDAWLNLGNLYFLRGNMNKAREYFLRAQSSGVAGATECLKSLDDYRIAKEEYEAALEEWKKYGFDKY